MNNITEAVVTVFTAIIGVAILSVLVSPKAKTSSVIQAIASGFGNSLAVAQSPVTGNKVNIDTSYPSDSGFGLPALSGFGEVNMWN